MKTMKSYSELMEIDSYLDRFYYLKNTSPIGVETFGFNRWLNQNFYNTKEWRSVRNSILVRDNGLDLAHPDYPARGLIVVHHINPITVDDVLNRAPMLLDPENLISSAELTHKAIHYGDESLLTLEEVERKPNDTKLW